MVLDMNVVGADMAWPGSGNRVTVTRKREGEGKGRSFVQFIKSNPRIAVMAATAVHLFFLLRIFMLYLRVKVSTGQEFVGACDKPRNAQQPFCDSSLPIDARVQSLIDSLTFHEKLGLLNHVTRGATQMVDLDEYNWWSEALHGVADSPGVHFRPPTEHSTAFPQIINLAASFNKELFFLVGNVTGNEARAFFNVGNAGLTYWSPNINIYRDPRWGRGHETPGEDPHLNEEFARAFVDGLQGDVEAQGGFLKTSACCKHFVAHSLEEGRDSFNSIVNVQDMADTYLPAFKSCVEESKVTCIMCAYNAVNGIPACADKGLLTGVIREQWGFDGYITSDCGAVGNIMRYHNYTRNETETCRVVLDAGVDIECSGEAMLTNFIPQAIAEGLVTEEMVDTAAIRSLKVLMRLGYFEKEATRPYKELLPAMVDSDPHQALALEAARQSIVLLKNDPNAFGPRAGRPPLPLDSAELRSDVGRRASMAVIGPFGYGGEAFLANYHGIPSFIKEPVDEIRKHMLDLEYEWGCNVTSFENARLQEAEYLARESGQVILFVGINMEVEQETIDRPNLTLPGLQNELTRRVLTVVQSPVILVVVSGGAIALEEWKADPRVGAIVWAGYLGQSAGEAMADVIFGVYNPSGRLPQTFYNSEFVNEVASGNMNVRPGNRDGSDSPGRTYRFYTGQPVYEFGYGLSTTTFDYSIVNQLSSVFRIAADAHTADECSIELQLAVVNSGDRAGDHSVLWFIAPPGAGQGGRPVKSLLGFDRVNELQPQELRHVAICLNRDDFQLANEAGEFQVVPGEWKLMIGYLERTILVV